MYPPNSWAQSIQSRFYFGCSDDWCTNIRFNTNITMIFFLYPSYSARFPACWRLHPAENPPAVNVRLLKFIFLDMLGFYAGKLGPGRLGPLSQTRQTGLLTFVGPICRFPSKVGPCKSGLGKWGPIKLGPSQIGTGQIGPQQIGPLYYIYLYWIFTANNLGTYVSRIYILLLDIFCQQLGDMCQLEGVSAVCGRRVGECAFSKI